MNQPKPSSAKARGLWPERLFALAFGAVLGLALLKFGNPPIMEKWVSTPTNIYEFVLGSPWPIRWAYTLLVLVLVGAMVTRRPAFTWSGWFLLLPAVWLCWQIVAGTQSVDAHLSWPTVVHFAACTSCFYLGYFYLRKDGALVWFAPGVLASFALVLAAGWSQRFGGLEETRRYFYAYVYPTMQDVPPEYLKKMASNRIFSTLFYPNALAGALLLVTPFCLAAIAGARQWFTSGARWFLCLVVAAASLACLYWSGSKGGWLLMLLLSLFALLRLRFPRRFKVALVGLVLLAGLAGFFLKYAGFFEKGATSVAARFDYWHAALETAEAHPLVGTGPGTFARPYERLKRPESEMSRLTHNDYLEQASDSGWPAFLLYAVFVVGGLVYGYPRQAPGKGAEGGKEDWLTFAVWLGVLGWALQSAEEFSLYIPALAWLAFAWLGWLLRSADLSPQQRAKASRIAT